MVGTQWGGRDSPEEERSSRAESPVQKPVILLGSCEGWFGSFRCPIEARSEAMEPYGCVEDDGGRPEVVGCGGRRR